MIFIDSTVPLGLVGADRSRKAAAQGLLEGTIAAGERLVTSAQVLQDILERCSDRRRRDALQPALDALLGVADEVLPVTRGDAERAKELLLGTPKLSARVAGHVAVMQRNDVFRVMSFDRGFDEVPGVLRLR